MVLQPTGNEGNVFGFITVLSVYKDDVYYGNQKYYGICRGTLAELESNTCKEFGVVGANPYLSYDDGVTELYTSSGGVIKIDTASHKDVSSDYCYAYMKGNTWVAVIKKGDGILNLAQVILGVPQFLDVAFKNGNTLDLRKENMVVY